MAVLWGTGHALEVVDVAHRLEVAAAEEEVDRAAVAGLQITLAATGYCLGCRLYFLRWYVPGLFTRLAR